MKRKLAIAAGILLVLGFLGAAIVTAIPAQSPDERVSGPSLTIYNQNFAVIRQPLSLDLKPGVNEVRFTDVTSFLEPDSIMVRDPLGRRQLQVLEQSFRNDPVSQERLLSLYEGRQLISVSRTTKSLPEKSFAVDTSARCTTTAAFTRTSTTRTTSSKAAAATRRLSKSMGMCSSACPASRSSLRSAATPC